MLHFLCCSFFALCSTQLTSQTSANSEESFDTIELTIIAYRNEFGLYVVDWGLTDSSGSLPDNGTINVITEVTESDGQITLKLGGIYKVTESLRQNATPDSKTDIPKSDVLKTPKIQEISTVPTKAVPKDYEYFPGFGYYKFYPEGGKSFNEAMKTCSNDGVHLAIVNTVAEMNVLKGIFARYPERFDYAYLGFHDQSEEGRFVTIFGNELSETGYEAWSEGEPNQYGGNEDCGGMHRRGGLIDLPCTGLLNIAFFCEY